MAPPPPAKRQKRLLLRSSDDDAVATAMQGHKNGSSSSHVSEDTGFSSIAKRAFPRKSRRKRPASKAPGDTQTSTSPRSTNKSHAQQSVLTASRQPSKPSKPSKPSRPISTFFGATGQEQHPNVPPDVRQKRKIGIKEPISEEACKNEDEDTIEDDSSCEKLAKPKGSQCATRSILDRRNTSLRPNANSIVPSRQGRPPSASQRFKIAEDGVANDTKTRESSKLGMVDPRPWAERFAPISVEELAVHRKKVTDVRSWLESVFLDKDRKVRRTRAVRECRRLTSI